MALANLGKLDETVKLCEESALLEPTNVQTYFTLAMALVELNKVNEAESTLRKTLFLDRKFVLGYFQLGLLLLRKKEHQAGLKCLRNALAIVKTMDASLPVAGFGGLPYGDLSKILEQELALHTTVENNFSEKTT